MKDGRLVVVGAGYRGAAHMTPEALASITRAQRVFYALDAVTSTWLRRLQPNAESLQDCYAVGKDRRETYEEMVERILTAVRQGANVCVVFYGHPGVFVHAGHEAIRRARKEGFQATMLPAVSAEGCLWADMEIDPSMGCQSFEASDFLIYRRRLDTARPLVLWQAGLIGVGTYQDQNETWSREGLRILAEVLQKSYPRNHRVIVYESTPFAGFKSDIQYVRLADLPSAPVTVQSTLCVPPARPSVLPKFRTVDHARNGASRDGGKLTIVGLGYRASAQVTAEALNQIQRSNRLFFLVYDEVVGAWLRRLNPGAVSLRERLGLGIPWSKVIDEIVMQVCEGHNVCFAVSGHPAVCLMPSYEAAKRVRKRGFAAEWQPGISVMDCLYADLGIDPGNHGCQLFESGALVHHGKLDPRIPLIVLQPGVNDDDLPKLKKLLQRRYPAKHKVILYEAAVFPTCNPLIRRMSLSSLSSRNLTWASTLYIPPASLPAPDYRIVSRLGKDVKKA